MASTKRRKPRRKRVGRVSYFFHHGSWWVYYLEGQRQVRRRFAPMSFSQKLDQSYQGFDSKLWSSFLGPLYPPERHRKEYAG